MPEDHVIFKFSDGERSYVPTQSGLTLLSLAKNAGLSLAADCTEGFCGTCQGDLLRGAVRYQTTDGLFIDDAEIESGAVLPCQAIPDTGVIEVALPYERASILPKRKRKLVVASINRISASVWEVVAETDGLGMFPFLGGQYVHVQVPGTEVKRSYSMSTPPGEDKVCFLIRELPGGVMSRYLSDRACLGDVWNIEGPYGTFYRRYHDDGRLLMLAGGTGVAPMLSILRSMEKSGDTERSVTLCFGVTDQSDAFYRDELTILARAFEYLDLRFTAMTHDDDWDGISGTVIDALDSVNRVDSASAAYLCGPPPMIDAARLWLADKGLPVDKVYAEEFLPAQ